MGSWLPNASGRLQWTRCPGSMIAPFYATAQIAAQQHVRQIEIETQSFQMQINQ
jgi:hypothetical protein